MKKVIMLVILIALTIGASTVMAASYSGIVNTPYAPNDDSTLLTSRPCTFFRVGSSGFIALRKDNPHYEDMKKLVLLSFAMQKSIYVATVDASDNQCSGQEEVAYLHL